MADKGIMRFMDRLTQAEEEEYFREQERELIEKLRKKNATDTARQDLAKATGMADEQLLADLQALGFSADTISVLHLLPLASVAWADGRVSDRERALVIEAARARGVGEGTPADRQLQSWLDARPSDDAVEAGLRIAASLLAADAGQRETRAGGDLTALCLAVARASGGILCFSNPVSAAEQAVLEQVSAEIERAHASSARALLAKERR